MENGESTEASAIRETKEETGASIHGLRLQSMISLPEYDQVHLFYRAQLTRPEWHLTHESTAIELLSLTQIPWAELAFSTVKLALEHHVRLERGEAEPFLDSVIAVPAPK